MFWLLLASDTTGGSEIVNLCFALTQITAVYFISMIIYWSSCIHEFWKVYITYFNIWLPQNTIWIKLLFCGSICYLRSNLFNCYTSIDVTLGNLVLGDIYGIGHFLHILPKWCSQWDVCIHQSIN